MNEIIVNIQYLNDLFEHLASNFDHQTITRLILKASPMYAKTKFCPKKAYIHTSVDKISKNVYPTLF